MILEEDEEAASDLVDPVFEPEETQRRRLRPLHEFEEMWSDFSSLCSALALETLETKQVSSFVS